MSNIRHELILNLISSRKTVLISVGVVRRVSICSSDITMGDNNDDHMFEKIVQLGNDVHTDYDDDSSHSDDDEYDNEYDNVRQDNSDSDDENSNNTSGKSKDTTAKVTKKQKAIIDEENAILKKEKKKRKFEEFKAKKKAALTDTDISTTLDDDDNDDSDITITSSSNKSDSNPLSVSKMFELFLINQPPLMSLNFTQDNFILTHLSGGGKKCEFTKGIIAGIPNGFKKVLNTKSKENGCPNVVILTASAIRATEIINSLSQNLHCKIAKLFAKHFKLQDQMETLSKQHFPIVVGTPNRICKLCEMGALKLNECHLVLIDVTKDIKQLNILSMADVKDDFYNFMEKHVEPDLNHIKLSMIEAAVTAEAVNDKKKSSASKYNKANNYTHHHKK